ncbi:MAG: class I SAM-dependent methyltransferase [Tagaea sp.]|nr:class I SAM-dependent methyltransferase [Tagaea sp.]
MSDRSDDPHELIWTPELVGRFWDWQSRFPENYFAHQFGTGIAERVAPYIGGVARVLDFGCGSGVFIERLLRATEARIHGADLSARSLSATTARNGAHPRFGGAASARALLDAGLRFDTITALETVEHVYDADLDAIVTLLRRLAAPRARIVFTTPNREDLAASTVYCPVANVTFHRWQHVRSWSADSLVAFMSARGLQPVEILETDLTVGRKRYALHVALRRVTGRAPAAPHLFAAFEAPG